MPIGASNAEDSCLKNQVEVITPDSPVYHKNQSRRDDGSLTDGAGDTPRSDDLSATGDHKVELEKDAGAHTGQNDDYVYPEGGSAAWLVVAGAWCGMFIVFGLANSTGAFQEIFVNDLLKGHSPDQIGWIFSINLFCTFFGGIYAGIWFDAYGPRMPLLIGCVAMVVGMMLLGLCTEYWHFLLDYGILCGFAGACINTPAYASIAHFFDRKRGTATGIANTAGSLGGIILPLILRGLVPSVGFAWATRAIAFIFLALAIPACIFPRKRLPSTVEKVSIIPELRPLRDVRLAICVLGVFLMEYGLFTPIAYISSFCNDNDLGASFGFVAITLLNVGSIFGRIIPGLIADRAGRFNVIVCTIAMCFVTIFAFWLPAANSQALVIVFAITFGFASGSNLGLIPVCVSQLCSTDEFGRYLAACYFVISFGTLTSVPIGGTILTATGGAYWGVIVFAGLSYVAAMLCYAAVRVYCVGWRLKIKF